MQKRNKQQGFFLLETVLVGILLMVACGAFGLERSAQVFCTRDAAVMTAAFLAQEQFACIEGKKGLSEGTVAWLGAGENPVQRNRKSFQVKSRLQRDSMYAGLWLATVIVVWQEADCNKELVFQRWVRDDG